jgi:hypothetical protein
LNPKEKTSAEDADKNHSIPESSTNEREAGSKTNDKEEKGKPIQVLTKIQTKEAAPKKMG